MESTAHKSNVNTVKPYNITKDKQIQDYFKTSDHKFNRKLFCQNTCK